MRTALLERIRSDPELKKAVEILRRKGYAGKIVYVPRTSTWGEKRKEIIRLLRSGKSVQEVADEVGASETYVYQFLREVETEKEAW